MNFLNGFLEKIKSIIKPEAPKISCPKCGAIHELNIDAACPECGTKYKLPEQYIELAKRNAARKDARDRRKAKLLGFFGLFRPNTEQTSDSAAKAKKSKLKIRIAYVCGFVLVCAVFVLVTLGLFSDKEPLHFVTDSAENQPLFFSDTDGIVHYLFPDGSEGNIGKGTVSDYAASSDGKTVYLTFTGFLSPTESYTSNTDSSNFLMSLTDFGKLSLILESKTSVPEFVAAGDCEYVFIRVAEEQNRMLGTLSVIHDGRYTASVVESVRDLCVSPNGHYALLSVDDSGASKLMKYSLANNALENPGVKNAYPLSIDNKGEYIVYAKKNDSTSLMIVSEKDTSTRLEVPVIDTEKLRAVVFAADRRSFAVKYTDRMTFYTCGTDTYSTMGAYEGSEFCYDMLDSDYNLLYTESIPAIVNVAETELLPFHYYDRDSKTLFRLDEGTQTHIFNRTVDDVVISENERTAFVSEGKLFCGDMGGDGTAFEMGEFGGKTLVDISPDGKLIAYSDSDGNLFTLEYGKTIANQNMGIKRSVDVSNARFSDDSKKLLVTSDGVTSLVNLKNGESTVLTTDIIAEYTYVYKGDLSHIAYAAYVPTENEGEKSKTLYIYKNGKSTIASENLDAFVLPNYAKRIDVTRSDYVSMTESGVQ